MKIVYFAWVREQIGCDEAPRGAAMRKPLPTKAACVSRSTS
jgi:hypothetical protein